MKDIKLDVIYSSPLGRALDTTKYMNGESNTKIVLLESLKEIGFGFWEGIEHSKIKKERN